MRIFRVHTDSDACKAFSSFVFVKNCCLILKDTVVVFTDGDATSVLETEYPQSYAWLGFHR